MGKKKRTKHVIKTPGLNFLFNNFLSLNLYYLYTLASLMIKYFILSLLVAMLISLFTGGFFLIKDKGTTKRTAYSLGIRVSIAAVLFATIVYGVVTGQIGPGV